MKDTMGAKYFVERSFPVKDGTILVLDKKIEWEDFNKNYIKDDAERIPYRLTHNEYLISIDGNRDLSGHEIEFC